MGFSFNSMAGDKKKMVSRENALKGRDEELEISGIHHVNGRSMKLPFPDGIEVAYFALGCFWGAEKFFWQIEGVYVTAVGYQGGFTKNPTYEESCTALTGHAEAVLVAFYPSPAPTYYYAEEYHQQYLSKNPNGYCSLRGTGVSRSF